MEKISESHIREEKIKKLKEQILSEIDKCSKRNIEYLKTLISQDEIDQEEYDYIITQEFNISKLKDYVNFKGSFNSFSAKYPSEDIIIYLVHIDNINIWLQEDYNFVGEFLAHIEYDNIKDVFTMLNDRYFAYEFTSIFDLARYHEKMEKENGKDL